MVREYCGSRCSSTLCNCANCNYLFQGFMESEHHAIFFAVVYLQYFASLSKAKLSLVDSTWHFICICYAVSLFGSATRPCICSFLVSFFFIIQEKQKYKEIIYSITYWCWGICF